jgi:hypothetical protein
MNLSEIFTLSRLNTGTDTSNMSDATLLSISNITYRDLINKITSKVDEDFFYQEWTAPTVIGQSEYTFPVRTSVVAGLKKLEQVSVKYKATDVDFTPLRPWTVTNLDKDKNWYKTNQPESDPFYIVYDKSVSIFPVTTEVQSFILYGVSDPKELVLAETEVNIVIPLDYHHLMVLGNEYRIYKALRMTNEKNDALNEYNMKIAEMVAELSDRIIRPLESQLPALNQLS